MKKSSFIFNILALLFCLSGCEDSVEDIKATGTPAADKPKMIIEPKLSQRTQPLQNPDYDERDALEDLDAAEISAPFESDMEADKYDYDTGMPAPESGEPVVDEQLPKE